MSSESDSRLQFFIGRRCNSPRKDMDWDGIWGAA